MKKFLFFLLLCHVSFAQEGTYWQQHADYTMDIDMDVEKFQYKGYQKLLYTNNSPDILNVVYYHLQLNAFQPGSDMDIRLQHIPDPDRRMVNNLGTRENPVYQSRIAELKPNEMGYQRVISLTQNGKKVDYEVIGTILKVKLVESMRPGDKAKFEMEFDAQVPLQIRRNGRNNREGVALSMAQWYPKLAEYDDEGWHISQYIAREFYGVWGDYDVTIHIDKDYVVGGTGYLQNPQEVGHGYEDKNKALKLPNSDKLTWHFKAPNVHDFSWAADPAYVHDMILGENGVELHFFYKNNPETNENWKKLQPKTAELLAYYNKHLGEYPYKQYSVIQAGDGGMEYAMCTFITGGRNLGSLIGVTAHEFAHSWFQFLLATNELKHGWMDEGFTSYISSMAENEILDQKLENPNEGSYNGYYRLVASGVEQPQSLHADMFDYNFAYSNAAYSKGAVFLAQLAYIIGEENLAETLKKYYADFKFKHPKPNDIKRTAEKVSGLQLDWYLNLWTQTTSTIDYGIKDIQDKTIRLEKIGTMPMPLDILVTYSDGKKELYHIPLQEMMGHKPTNATILPSWSWVHPSYSFQTKKQVKSVEIDPENRMADIDKTNNNNF
ncbi:MAG: M1 family metallopeptidase [Lutimonas sp.]